jgi:anti-anti-sigma factor
VLDPTASSVQQDSFDDGPDFGDPASVYLIVGASRARLVLSGEIDAELGLELTEAFEEAEATNLPIEIDAHHITFIDSSGVASLARIASRVPYKIRMLRTPPSVKFLLEVTRIGELLEIVDADDGID